MCHSSSRCGLIIVVSQKVGRADVENSLEDFGNCRYFETSARAGTNVSEAIETAVKMHLVRDHGFSAGEEEGGGGGSSRRK